MLSMGSFCLANHPPPVSYCRSCWSFCTSLTITSPHLQLGTIVEDSKQTYITDTLSTPPIPTILTLAIVHSCTQMVWQWEFQGIGSGQNRIRGVTIITVADNKQVVHQYVEFNSLAWAENIGFNITPPAGGAFGR